MNYLYLSALLFTIGAAGVLLRRNAIVMFMRRTHAQPRNLAFVTFSRMHGQLDGQVVAFFTMVVAACEVVVGLAINHDHLPDPAVGVRRRRRTCCGSDDDTASG